MLNISNIDQIQNSGRGEFANCWGSTMYALGAIEKPKWADQREINIFLKDYTKESKASKRFKKGTIVAMYRNGDIIHTGIYMGKGKWWHKPGMRAAEFVELEDIYYLYDGDFDSVKMFVKRGN